MLLSVNIILDRLSELPLENHIPMPSSAAFSCCALLPRNPADLRREYLHVCRLSEALLLSGRAEGMHYLCVRDRLQDGEETEQALEGMIIVNENLDVVRLLNRVQLLFNSIRDWYQDMQSALIQERSLQELLDLSEPILGNTINISDSAFTLLARTRHIETDDPVSLALAELGYHPESTLRLFRGHRRYEAWADATSLLVNDSRELAPYTLVNKVFRFRNTYFTHVVMVCDHHPISPGLLELFTMLTEILAIYAERNWKGKSALSHNYDQFMTDLLSRELTSAVTISERAQYLGIRDTGRFCLVKIAAAKGMEASLGRIGRDLLEQIPSCQVILYQEAVVALVHLTAAEQGGLPSFKRTETLLEHHQARAGVSNEFSSLTGMADAYEQASIALTYSCGMRGETLLNSLMPMAEADRICFFQNRVLHGLLGAGSRNEAIWRESKYYSALKCLYDYDGRHGSNNLRLLRVYLYLERKATEVGQTMHMHRNNVLYHIARIEELTGLSMDDHSNRLGLELSFLLLELYGME